MSENRETENLRSPRFGLNVLYHRDQAKLDSDFYAAHAKVPCLNLGCGKLEWSNDLEIQR